MSNPTFVSGPIGFDVAEAVERNRLVAVTEGGIRHAEPADVIFGAVSSHGVPDPDATPGLNARVPARLAVHIGPSSLPLSVADSEDVAQGAALYAASDGQVSTSGDHLVAVAARDSVDGTVIATLLTPSAPTPSGGGSGE